MIFWRRSHCLALKAEMTSLKRGLAFSIGLFKHSGSQDLRKSFIIRNDPNQLFNILGYLLALAIHDNIFATEFRGVEEAYRIEIPPHMNDVKFRVKETKLDLLILRRPTRLSNESRASTVMGLLGNYSEPQYWIPKRVHP
jgi:hypothetical protein